MALISNGDLQVVMDKLARFAGESACDPELSGSFNGGMEVASNSVFTGAGALDQFVLDIGDVDVAADLLPPARDLDENHPVPGSNFIRTLSQIQLMLAALDSHVARYTVYDTLDAYLTSLNVPTPTLRAHHHFRKYFGGISARNSFVPVDTVLATFACTGAATGTFTSVAILDRTEYAGAKLVVKNAGAVTTGATISVTGKKWDNTTAVITATIGTATDDHETDLSETAKLFVQVTNVTITGGTNSDDYEIVAKTDRSIVAA